MITAHYPEHPGAKTGGTSPGAADAMAEPAPNLRAQVLALFGRIGPITTDDAAEFLGKTVLAVRPRFSELRKMGLIEDSGRRRNNISGRPANVWRLRTATPQPELFNR